jgi:cytochrome c-type biogenesis protein CcmH
VRAGGGAASILAALLAFWILLPSVALAQQVVDPNTDPRVREVARDLQCPICQNLSVADSPSALAGDMRALIAKQLEQGRSKEQIEQFFVERYGEGILLNPPRRGFTGLIWLGPWIALGLGLLLVGGTLWRLRRSSRLQVPGSKLDTGPRNPLEPRSATAQRHSEPDRYEQQLEAELAEYRERAG